MGRARPNMKVMKITLSMEAYLKWIRYSGPEYRSTYCYIDYFLVLYVFLHEQVLSNNLYTTFMRYPIKNSIGGVITLIAIV